MDNYRGQQPWVNAAGARFAIIEIVAFHLTFFPHKTGIDPKLLEYYSNTGYYSVYFTVKSSEA